MRCIEQVLLFLIICRNHSNTIQRLINVQNCNIWFQVVDPDVPAQDRTLYILARYISKERKANVNPDHMCKIHLKKFLEGHETWCKDIAYNHLQFKQLTWEQFKLEWLHESFALNMVGIFIWVRAYHKHITVFFGYSYWTTHIDHDLNKVNIFLLYRGHNRFDETHMVGSMEYRVRYREFARKARKIETFPEGTCNQRKKKRTRYGRQ